MSAEPVLWSLICERRDAWDAWARSAAAIRAHRAAVAARQSKLLEDAESAAYHGVCWACGAHALLLFDRRYASPGEINWRERLVCTQCNLNCRLRLALHVLEGRLGLKPGDSIYLTEHLTPLAKVLRQRGWNPQTSEFVRDIAPGTTDARGIRCEDLTQLTFGSSEFDALLCFDVLEHVPDYNAALREMRRVLRPGGRALLSFPFSAGRDEHLVRASVLPDGTIEHRLPPEYHGDPVDPKNGVLCYYHFAWAVLDDMRRAGFDHAAAHWFWSSDYGYIGPEQVLFVASVDPPATTAQRS